MSFYEFIQQPRDGGDTAARAAKTKQVTTNRKGPMIVEAQVNSKRMAI